MDAAAKSFVRWATIGLPARRSLIRSDPQCKHANPCFFGTIFRTPLARQFPERWEGSERQTGRGFARINAAQTGWARADRRGRALRASASSCGCHGKAHIASADQPGNCFMCVFPWHPQDDAGRRPSAPPRTGPSCLIRVDPRKSASDMSFKLSNRSRIVRKTASKKVCYKNTHFHVCFADYIRAGADCFLG